MSNVLILILVFLTAGFLFESLINWLNMKAWSPELPAEAKDFYDTERYRTSQKYFRANQRLSRITAVLGFLLSFFLLATGLFGKLDNWLRHFTDQPVWLSVLFFGVIALASDLLGMPFSLYRTFVIEQKFGFNKTTARLYITDKLKGWVLGALIGGGLIALLTWIYIKTGSAFWYLAWGVTAVVMVFTSMFYTSLILPLFNKLTPLPDGELRTAIYEYAGKTGFAFKNIFVMDGSKRSAKSNAFFSGLGRHKKIVLFDTLIRNHTTEELVAVLAHEMGHNKLKHTTTGLFMALLQSALMFFVLSLFLGNDALPGALGAAHSGFHLEILAFTFLYSPLSTLTGIVSNMVSRKHEFQADAFAKKTYSGTALAAALEKLSVDNLSNLTPHPAYVFVHYSHPPLLKRLHALNEF